jgi:DNA-binding transcriptional LysR family regulator
VEAVARHANFTRAAAELNVAQPALSLAVRNLEQELGLRLFERTSRRVVITDAGLAFVARARRILAEADGLGDEMAEYSAAVRGRIRIASSFHLDPNLPELLRIFARDNPSVEFSIVDMPSAAMLDGLRKAEIDVAFPLLSPELDMTDLEHLLVREEPLVMVVAPSDPIAALSTVRLEVLATRPYICCQPGTALRHWLDEILARAGIGVRVAIETHGVGAMVTFASIGLGATVLTSSIAEAMRTDAALIPISDAPPFRLGLAWRAAGRRSPVADSFLDLMHRTLKR